MIVFLYIILKGSLFKLRWSFYMMSYHSFLYLLSQIGSQNKAKIIVEDHTIFIERDPETNGWNLSTNLFRVDRKNFSYGAWQCLSQGGSLRWQKKGAYLKHDRDTSSIYLVQEILSSKKYLPFKHLIQDFTSIAREWKEILEGFVQKGIRL